MKEKKKHTWKNDALEALEDFFIEMAVLGIVYRLGFLCIPTSIPSISTFFILAILIKIFRH